jgi:hypothetical protein
MTSGYSWYGKGVAELSSARGVPLETESFRCPSKKPDGSAEDTPTAKLIINSPAEIAAKRSEGVFTS